MADAFFSPLYIQIVDGISCLLVPLELFWILPRKWNMSSTFCVKDKRAPSTVTKVILWLSFFPDNHLNCLSFSPCKWLYLCSYRLKHLDFCSFLNLISERLSISLASLGVLGLEIGFNKWRANIYVNFWKVCTISSSWSDGFVLFIDLVYETHSASCLSYSQVNGPYNRPKLSKLVLGLIHLCCNRLNVILFHIHIFLNGLLLFYFGQSNVIICILQ